MRRAAEAVISRIQQAGHRALFAGGCVRDLRRGIDPKDYDIATDATPEEILGIFPEGNTVGAHFGVVLVKQGGFHFEIATFRAEGEYKDGRRPESVTFTTPEQDAKRRDFTINGMFYDPESESVIDYVGGLDDLDRRLIRAIGDPVERFREDYLRMLRAVRFATVLDFEIEQHTFAALRARAPHAAEISPERIRDELDKIWLSPRRVKGFDLLVESHLMQAILPEILTLQGCEQPPQFHPEGDVFVHTRLMLELLPPDASLPLVLSVLLHDIAKPETYSYDSEADRIRFNGHDKLGAEMSVGILKRLRYPNHVIEAVETSVANHMIFKDVQRMRTAKLKRFMARETFGDELELHRVDCASSHGMLDNWDFLREKAEEFAAEPLIPPRLVTGHDLMQLGWTPGPELGEWLTRIQDLQLEGMLTSREQALEWVKAEMGRGN
ncbi:MAG: CCA tRNA nucleotidyltransferase [Verrucomicrobiae bacterium]|nr:CCA tRNA nucleotidyltransferase [Verrucomicrobiae bacterium]